MIVLKKYLKYARTGERDLAKPTENDPDSLFEEDVAHALRQAGFEVEYQVGSAGFLIDLGVRHPDNQSEFILGIECDGASYHSARSARDRDRIRQSVLERNGWSIYRVWSTDWFKNKEKEVGKLLQRIQWDLKGKKNDSAMDKTTQVQSEFDKPSFTRKEEEKKPGALSGPYQKASISDINALKEEYHRKHGSDNVIEALIEKISSVESPIHRNILFSDIVDYLGYGKMGRRIKRNIENALESIVTKETIFCNNGFVYHRETELKVRDRSKLPSEYRKIENIPPEEIQKAMVLLLEKSYGAEAEELIKETGALFGINRIYQGTYEVLEENLSKLIDRGDAYMRGGKVYAS
jgi:very-short-patch-repair endonuclease